MYNFRLKQTYSFNVFPVPILGNSFSNVTVVAIMDQEQANKEIDTNALHTQIYPYLPANSGIRPDSFDYVKIKFPSGATTILAVPWIDEASVVETTNTVFDVKITGVVPADVDRLRNALLQNGFNDFTIKVT